MPLVRVEVRNVYGLGKTELHRDVDREDPKAILDGVAVSGLVGILRQLGDLTEFATEIFHGIQEEVILTASRSNKLKMRLKQIEATVPSIQKAVLAETNHIQFAYTGGLEWHPRIPNVQDYFVCDDLPQCIMAPYDDCRDPPRLHLLDKFDINGPGSCLKRYTDPTHFKRSSRASKLPEVKKKKSLPRSRDISRITSMANQSDRKTLTSLSFSGRTSSSKTASTMETESKFDLQDQRSCSFDSRSGGEKLKGVSTSSRFTPGPRTIASVLSESESEDENDDSPSQDLTARGSSCVSWQEKAEIVEDDALKLATGEAPEVMETNAELESGLKEHREVESVQDIKPSGVEMDREDETESEEDDFVDALYTIDSESDNDQEVQKKISNEITEEEFDNYGCEQETENISSNFSLDHEEICDAASDLHLSSLVEKPDEMIQGDPWEALDISNGTPHSYSNGFSNPLYDTNGVQEHQESEDESSCDNEEGTKLWTNGNLLGLEPSKPKIVEETIQETDDEALQEPLREANKAAFDWITASPQLDHMKISFSPSETLPSSKLKLKLPDEYTFSSFQLVPETNAANSLQDSDSDKDTFCRSSSYISDNSDNHSVSISEQQSEEEPGERKSQRELYDDSFNRINTEASSLSAPSSQFETSNGYLAAKISYLQNPAEPLPPPLPPLQWMVSKVPSERFEDNNKQSFKDILTRALEQRSSLSIVKKEEPNSVIAYDPKPDYNKQSFKDTLTHALEQRSSLSTVKKEEPNRNSVFAYDPKTDNNKQSFKDTLTRALEQRGSLSTVKKEDSNSVIAYAPKPENNVHQKNNVRDYKQSHANAKETEDGDFLHQIRTKQFTLRRVVTTKASSSEATMNNNFSAILEKANSIRQAVASDDGDGQSDTWSDSDT